jgi:hypothetical protein
MTTPFLPFETGRGEQCLPFVFSGLQEAFHQAFWTRSYRYSRLGNPEIFARRISTLKRVRREIRGFTGCGKTRSSSGSNGPGIRTRLQSFR